MGISTVTEIRTPIHVSSSEGVGNLELRSLTGDDALCGKVVEFLENNDFEFYRYGKRYTHEDALKTVQLLRNRTENGNPFSAFSLLDKGKVVGLIRIGFDDDPRKIQIAGMGLETYQNRGLGLAALKWIFESYLPALHAKGYRLPVFDASGTRVVEWVDLDQTSVVAVVHPDYAHCNHLLSKFGFSLVKQIKNESFAGVHDGRRNVYEIALKRFIHQEPLTQRVADRSFLFAKSIRNFFR